MKSKITKQRLQKIETILAGGLGAITMVAIMEGHVTDNVIKIRDKTIQDIMKLLTEN